MCVGPELVALLPNSVVRLAPMIANVFAALAQHLLHFMVWFFVSKKTANRLNNFTVNVELRLLARSIADPHRPRGAITSKMP